MIECQAGNPPQSGPQRRLAEIAAKRPGASTQPPTVSPRWLAGAIAVTLWWLRFAPGGLCACWCGREAGSCFTTPARPIARTPASVGIAFSDIGIGANEAGIPTLQGWWIPAAPDARNSRYTAIYLHGASGNLGNSVDALERLHSAGLNVLAFDYRGYGKSQFIRPSEAHWREDADSALQYLTGTRHIAPQAIVLVGSGLGANLALEVAAAHPELAGVVLERPLVNPAKAIFNDPRTHLVPAHAFVKDRWDSSAAAASLLIPSLWFAQAGADDSDEKKDFGKVTATKMLVWLPASGSEQQKDFMDALSRWLDGLPGHP